MLPYVYPVKCKAGSMPTLYSQEFQQRSLAEDRGILERVIAAYHKAKESATEEIHAAMRSYVWGREGMCGKQATLIEALENGSAAHLHGILRQYFQSDAAHGIAMGAEELATCRSVPAENLEYGFRGFLLGLAHAVGALPLPYPEGDPAGWQNCLGADPEKVVEAIEARLGFKMSFPDICGVFGGEINGRPFPAIAYSHLLAAQQIRTLASAQSPHIVEIGGGFGGLAYFTSCLLPARYTIFDLPLIGAVQAYFLHRALPEHRLVLAGEAGGGGQEITIVPAWTIWSRPADFAADLVVNQNSLPEIPRQTACLYLRALKTFLRGPFLSINHEFLAPHPDRFDLTSVLQLTEMVGGFTCLSRSHFFVRMGYVQEIFYLANQERNCLSLRPTELAKQAQVIGHFYSSRERSLRNRLRSLLRLVKKGARAGLGKLIRSP